MSRMLVLGSMAAFLTSGLLATAADVKALKADVTIKQDDKTAKAKVGDIVEIKIDNPQPGTATSQTGIADLKVIIEKNKVLMDKHDEHKTVGMTIDGKSTPGSGYESIYLYPAAEGKAKVTIEFKKGGKAQSHEYVIEVKGKK